MPCDPEYLSNIRMFDHLNADDRVSLAQVIDELAVGQGHTLFQAGDPGDSLFIVVAGEIELFIKDTVGQKIVLTTAQPGDLFGELAMLDSGPRTATALALTDSEVLVLDRDDLMLLFQRRPEAALHMMASLSGLTRKADELLRTRVSRNVPQLVTESIRVVPRTQRAWLDHKTALRRSAMCGQNINIWLLWSEDQ